MQPTAAPVIEVELGGQTRRLRYTFRALKAIERVLPGVNALSGLADLFADLSATSAVAWIWAGLLHEDPNVTIEQVEEWLDFGTFGRIVEQMQASVTPAGEPQGENPPIAQIG